MSFVESSLHHRGSRKLDQKWKNYLLENPEAGNGNVEPITSRGPALFITNYIVEAQ
jgi:hypothetical protein